MELYYSVAILIVIAAFFSYFNARVLKLPPSIGVMLISLILSLVLVVWGIEFPKTQARFTQLLHTVNLPDLLMNIMLNFLLFAGAIHFRLKDLRQQKVPVIILSTLGVLLSTFIVGYSLLAISNLMHLNMSLLDCMLFGSLISPTDPIAVMGILKDAKVPASIETKVVGESLFNDGTAVVLFMTLNGVGGGEVHDLSFKGISILAFQEIAGGIGLGLLLGYISSLLIKRIDDYTVEVLISLAVVMGGSLLAQALHFSSPLAMVSAGLFFGSIGSKYSSEKSKEYLDKFWHIVDNLLNYILFILIGLEILVIPNVFKNWPIGIVTILIVLLGRLLSIFIPARIGRLKSIVDRNTIILLTWGGLRGGVSIALALSMYETPSKSTFVGITYIVVLFSIIVQGLTVGKMAKKLSLKD